MEIISANPSLSARAISERMSEKTQVVDRTVERDIAKLKKMGILTREGGRKEGHWVIVD